MIAVWTEAEVMQLTEGQARLLMARAATEPGVNQHAMEVIRWCTLRIRELERALPPCEVQVAPQRVCLGRARFYVALPAPGGQWAERACCEACALVFKGVGFADQRMIKKD